MCETLKARWKEVDRKLVFKIARRNTEANGKLSNKDELVAEATLHED